MEAHAPVRTSTSRSRFVHVSLSSSCVECTSTWLHPTCAAPRVSRTRRVPTEGAIGCRRPEGPSLAHPLHASDRRRQHSQLGAHLPQPHWAHPLPQLRRDSAHLPQPHCDGCGSAPLHCDPRCAAALRRAFSALHEHGESAPHSHEWQDPCLRERAARTNHPTCNGRHATHTGATREHARQRQACKVACAVARS